MAGIDLKPLSEENATDAQVAAYFAVNADGFHLSYEAVFRMIHNWEKIRSEENIEAVSAFLGETAGDVMRRSAVMVPRD